MVRWMKRLYLIEEELDGRKMQVGWKDEWMYYYKDALMDLIKLDKWVDKWMDQSSWISWMDGQNDEPN